MNNDQFRKLLVDQPNTQSTSSLKQNGTTDTKYLGRSSNLLGMVPRTAKVRSGVDFARPAGERNSETRPTKKFKSFTPRGVKLSAGYIDRAGTRDAAVTEDADEKAARILALEKQVKLGKLTQAKFEALRDEITGGDVSNTHLVKGLDRRLLERVRQGEVSTNGHETKETGENIADAEEELDELVAQEVQSVKRDIVEKKGNLSIAGRKRTRDEILADLKAQRTAAKEADRGAAPQLDSSKWKRVDSEQNERIEIDHKGREVLISIGEDGKVKKMVRKPNPAAILKTAEHPGRSVSHNANEDQQPVPISSTPIDKKTGRHDNDDGDGDDDIFAGAGTEYNPLGEEESDEADSEVDQTDQNDARPVITHDQKADEALSNSSTTVKSLSSNNSEIGIYEATAERSPADGLVANARPIPRNYFNEEPEELSRNDEKERLAGIHSILQKAARLGRDAATDPEDDADRAASEAKLRKRAEMLSARDRDLDDMDLGFGGSRNEDEEEAAGDGARVRLSEWKDLGAAADDDYDGQGGKGNGEGKKKRKPKKRKGDVNNAADVMRVLEGRRAGQT